MSTVIEEFVGRLRMAVDQSSFAAADKRLAGIGNSVKNIALGFGTLFAGSKLIGSLREQVNLADQLGDSAERLGVSTKSFQALGYAADQNASSFEEVHNALRTFQKNSQAAADGNKELAKAFALVGTSGAEIRKGLPTEESFLRVADAIQKTQNPAKKTALAMKLFGDAGAKLLPMLNKGSAGLQELFDEFERSGGGFTDDFIEQSSELNDELGKMHFQLQGITSQIGSQVLPVVNKMLTLFIGWTRSLSDIIKGSEYVRSSLVVAAAAFVAWGAASLFASAAARQKFGIIATLTILAALLDEIGVALKGGKTLIGTWIDKWAGLGTVDSLVRSIGQGLKSIDETLSKGTFWKSLGSDLEESINGTARREQRINKAKAAFDAETDPEKKKTLGTEYAKALRAQIDYQNGILGETPRAIGRGTTAAVEQIQAGTAGESAVNEGAYNTLFGGTGTATTNSKGQTIYQTVNNKTDVKVEATTNADAREIGRIAAEKVDEANTRNAQQLRGSLSRRKPSASNPGPGGDASLDGVDE